MDFYLNTENTYNRLKNEYKTHRKIIIAYDFDGTVFDYHGEGRTFDNVISLLQRWKNHAHFIVYTVSGKERHEPIKTYLRANSIPFDSINENIKGLNIPSGGKLYYNVLLDDRASLRETYNILLKLIDEIERGL
ncbi:hypothetical protein [Clostridium tagluense]|uniref:Hydrolase n=1 Tax=Clostridium tagluense TaxID=360422 RepID=A0A401UQC4_9CLOT|nr:hypothetical protein [Clostridium tagluense]GCD11698.1 hypothetical protein Ctaglu_33210 [Clostridium tagluense]